MLGKVLTLEIPPHQKLFVFKATSKQEGPKTFWVPDKKVVFFPYKRTVFLSGTPNFFGPSCFEAALVCMIKVLT